jgi:hypothetical protein
VVSKEKVDGPKPAGGSYVKIGSCFSGYIVHRDLENRLNTPIWPFRKWLNCAAQNGFARELS